MAEKEVKIKVTTETDIKDVEDLESKLQELQNQKLQLQIESDTAELEEVNQQIEETQNKLAELKADPTVDDSEIQALEDELADLESRRIDLEIAVNTAELDAAKASMDELESSSQGATGSIDGVGSALTAVAGAASLDQVVTTADNINMSWERLGHTFGSVTDTLKSDVSSAADATGRAGGLVRGYFNDMGIAGVKNTGLLRDSFEALAGQAVATNGDISSMENSLKRMVMTGNAGDRQLTQLGITADKLGQAMGMTGEEAKKAFKNLSQEERLQVLTAAMSDAKGMNDAYKNSLQGMKDQAQAAFAGLMGAVGQAILPVVIPALKVATQIIEGLTDAFKNLPPEAQSIVGVIGGVALVAVTLVGVLGVVGQVINGVIGGLSAFSGVLTFLMANPIVLVIAAIVALIAILVYLYYTNEEVRNAIDGFVSALYGIGETIYGYLVGAFEWLQGAWQNTVDFFTSGGQWLQDTWNNIVNAFMTYAPLVAQVLFVMATGGVGAIVLLIANMNGMPNQIGAILQSVISHVLSWVANLVSQFANGAQRAVNSFLSPLSGLVSAVSAELSAVYSAVMSFIQPLIDAFNALGSAASWAFSVLGFGQGSPGNIYRAVKNELEWTTEFVKADETNLASTTGQLGRDVVKSWGKPVLDIGFRNNGIVAMGDSLEVNSNGTGEIVKLLTELINAVRNTTTNNSNNDYTFVLNGDIDNEDRMQKFIDEIIRQMNWDNATAGRTMDVL